MLGTFIEGVQKAKVRKRKLGSQAGRAALVHAVAHIEFNAINLALDAVLRFDGLPSAYYQDWLSVARDEARHFRMLAGRLEELGAAYGDLPAHNGLWEMAEKTAADPLERMALVPRRCHTCMRRRYVSKSSKLASMGLSTAPPS